MREDFKSKTHEAQVLKDDITKAQNTLSAAQSMIQKLSEEKSRWQIQTQNLSQELAILPIFSFFSAAFVTYLSFKDENERSDMLGSCIKNYRQNLQKKTRQNE